MKTTSCIVACVAVGCLGYFHRAEAPRATPKDLVATYSSLADGILALNKTESNIVRAILAETYERARSTFEQANAKLKAGQPAKVEIESLAALVAELGNEGDNAVGGIRKRLIDGGHHHHANAEAQGLYDEGYVIVTRAAKKALLDVATTIGKAADGGTTDQLSAAFSRVAAQWELLGISAR